MKQPGSIRRKSTERLLLLAVTAGIFCGCGLAGAVEKELVPGKEEHQQEILILNDQFARFEGLARTITNQADQKFIQGMSDGFKGRIQSIQKAFDPVRFDELRLNLLVENQRLIAWTTPLKAPPAGSGGPKESQALQQKVEELSALSKPVLLPFTKSERTPIATSAAHDNSFSHKAAFIEKHCAECHDEKEKKGGLDLTSLAWKPDDASNFAKWVKVHDRLEAGEMPPKKKKQPDTTARDAYVRGLSSALMEMERKAVTKEGRATQRRLNAYEYENAMRDLFQAPWLQFKSSLPDDGLAYRFNKSGKSLDISHVQMSRFLSLADTAIRDAISVQANHQAATTRRFYARDQKILIKEYRQVVMNTWPDRQNFPLIGAKTDVEARMGRAPLTVGDSDPEKRELEAVGWLGIAFPKWDRTPIPVAGRYRLRFSGYTIWAGPNGYSGLFKKEEEEERIRQATRWYLPNIDDISPGRRDEPVSIYAEAAGQSRRLGGFDLTPEPKVYEIEAWLGSNESIMPRATRLYQPRPPSPTNPNAQRDGAPGVAFRWLEIEGPIHDETSTAGYRLMFDDLPLRKFEKGGKVIEVVTDHPREDAARLLRNFLSHACRRPIEPADAEDFLKLIQSQLDAGTGFAEAMIAGYSAVLASPAFLLLQESPGPLDDYALASRLSFFLWNSPPDEALRQVASKGVLHKPQVLWEETERMLADTKSGRFVDAFLDYWLDLRKMEETSPSITLYNDYYLDDALNEAALAEPRLYFAELLHLNLPARNIVSSDFAFLNERLAQHYGIPGVRGVSMRKVTLPPDSPRGGFLTQASVLKVTANGTTTSPVLRGKWITERILGRNIPPPPPVGAVEPDIRGAVTIRQQLEKHRSDPSCSSCHAKMDPPGFALENFDIFGGWRDRYRAISPDQPAATGFGKNGQPYEYHLGLPVDAAGELPDGRAFKDVREFKRLLVSDEKQEREIALNLLNQLTVYATGSPVHFSEREMVHSILAKASASQYGVRSLIHELIQSDLFKNK